MVHTLSRRALDTKGMRMLVLVADPDGPAEALYKRLGYRLRDVTIDLEKKQVARP